MTEYTRPAGMAAVINYVRQREAQPLRGLGDSVHHIHATTEWEADLRFSDLQKTVRSHAELVAALKGLMLVHRQQDTCGAMPADKGIAYGKAEAALARAGQATGGV